MKKTWLLSALALGVLAFDSAAWAQATPDRLAAIRRNLQQLKASSQNLPEVRRRVLSSAFQNALRLADVWDQLETGLSRAASPTAGPPSASSTPLATTTPAGAISVSNPANDFAFSVQTGFTQSETSTAWCGNHVVVGFNDSGSLPESIFFGPGGLSFSGVALSSDRGHSFQDLGFVNPGSNPANFLLGDPVLGCADASTFHYAQIFLTADSVGNPLTAVSVSTSSDGGATWADPVVAVSKSLSTHFLDKEWMAIDPTNTNRIYITYTDFDSSSICFHPIFGPGIRIAIESVRSADGGGTWSSPVVLEAVCSPFSVVGLFVQGSQVAVGPSGEVYVAWEFYDADFVTREIRIRKSLDHGASFQSFVKVDNVTCVGDCFALHGGFRDFLDLGGLAVDRSGTATNGTVYVVYQDGRNLRVPDIASSSGFYSFSDVLLRRSTSGGATWAGPVRVNGNPDPVPNGGGTDQYQAFVAVDGTGKVGTCWYDRRLDPQNYLIDRFCGVSTDAGASWTNTRRSFPSWAPIHAVDVFINPVYMGDYDVLASDFTKANPGFIGAFQMMNTRGGTSGNALSIPNPDVFATVF